MFSILIRFIVLPFVVFFIFGFLYYGFWKLLNPKKQSSETAS
jgi:hypothetical protein